MDTNDVLAHLLNIESEAARITDEAQAEADRRVADAEKRNRAVFDERYRTENEKLKNEVVQSTKLAHQRYLTELDAYKQDIASFDTDVDGFAAMLDKLVFRSEAAIQRGRV